MQESSKKSVLRVVSQSDSIEEAENSEDVSTSLLVNRCYLPSPSSFSLSFADKDRIYFLMT